MFGLENFEMWFVLFVAANTYFSYRAGEKEGTFNGMLSTFQFLKTKDALRDKNSVRGFSEWPLPLQEMYNNPHNVEID